jgi:hypothetical protein
MNLERDLGATPGPRFFRDDGVVMFAFVLDASSVVGPRVATSKDQDEHADAWRIFAVVDGVGPLDRDARDGDGGSLPGARRHKRVTREPANPSPEGR